ncbi:MAG TPA: aminotransferase class V-fold PLP-dependent enzyme, partial [Acidobacteriota bacterium]|nr:aminotransferase class V-fold PLP-dependent enzyme [Acidobacteriota bacterium]
MRRRILELERVARQLEPSAGQRKSVRDRVIRYTEKFLNEIEVRKAYQVSDSNGAGLLKSPVSERPLPADQVLALVRDHVDYPGLNPASGGHLGYIPGGGIYYASLGDYLADVTNRFSGVFYASPGAVRVENLLLRWLAGIVGYPKAAGGNLTTGGSLANLIGIVTARDAMNVRSRDVEKSVIYLSAQAHHSVDKDIRIAGLKEAVIRRIPLDEGYRIIPSELETRIAQDINEGLRPFLVIASAGTTDVGAIDPLRDIGRIARRHRLWYHVDAAYGGFFVLTREGKMKLRGMEMSDSIVIDPHKGLFLPYGLGVALVRDRSKLHASHYYVANYMQDALSANEE